MRQRTAQVGPDPGLVAQVLRLAIPPVEPGEGAEQAGIPLRRHDGVKLGKAGRVELAIGRAARLDVAAEQRPLELFGNVDPRVLQQRHQVVGGGAEYGVLEVDDSDAQDASAVAEPDDVGRMEIPHHPGSRRSRRLFQQRSPHRDEFVAMWRTLLEKPAAAPRTWVMRDFHSPNIIWLGDRAGVLRVGIIDFQDAVLGPAAYDLVSLLQDARIDVPEQLELTLLSRYIKARRAADGQFHPASFAGLYAIMSAQRNPRLLGTFARLNRRDGKPQYLRHQPRIWTYLSRSLAHPALSAFHEWYAANVPPPVP